MQKKFFSEKDVGWGCCCHQCSYGSLRTRSGGCYWAPPRAAPMPPPPPPSSPTLPCRGGAQGGVLSEFGNFFSLSFFFFFPFLTTELHVNRNSSAMSGDAALAGRIRKEMDELTKDTTSGIRVRPLNADNLRHFEGVLPGPKDSVYEGGVWRVDIVLPKNYPFEPPKMKYITPLWHPNVSSQTGAICGCTLVCPRAVQALFAFRSPCTLTFRAPPHPATHLQVWTY